MSNRVRDVMTADPLMCDGKATVADAARMMQESEIGDVLVESDGRICGILTDRDIVVRAVAEGRDPKKTKVIDIASTEIVTVGPDDTAEAAEHVMRERALRRLPVCDGDRPVGIISLGDLAVERDPQSCLADISAAPANA